MLKYTRLCILFYIPSQSTDKIEFVATEHFWMSGMYWGLSAMALLGRLEEMDLEVGMWVGEWVWVWVNG